MIVRAYFALGICRNDKLNSVYDKLGLQLKIVVLRDLVGAAGPPQPFDRTIADAVDLGRPLLIVCAGEHAESRDRENLTHGLSASASAAAALDHLYSLPRNVAFLPPASNAAGISRHRSDTQL